jgi:hypothetical protein
MCFSDIVIPEYCHPGLDPGSQATPTVIPGLTRDLVQQGDSGSVAGMTVVLKDPGSSPG